MNGSEKQIKWATEILSKFDGVKQDSLILAVQNVGVENLPKFGIHNRADMAAFAERCNEFVRSQDAGWIIDHRESLDLDAARALFGLI